MKNNGFTLIELLVTLLIVGILVFIALPRFIDIVASARLAALNNLKGAVQTAASTWHMVCAAKSGRSCNASAGVSRLNSGTQTIQIWNGWPDAGDTVGTNGIDAAVDASGFTVSVASGQITIWTPNSAPDPENCKVEYREAATAGSTPTVTLTNSGC